MKYFFNGCEWNSSSIQLSTQNIPFGQLRKPISANYKKNEIIKLGNEIIT